MMKEVVETPEAENRVTIGQPNAASELESAKRMSDIRMSNADDNLLSDVLGSRDQATYDKLLSSQDFEVSGAISDVKM